jgi:4-amino-4-deoxy-L-arabinose transferase-like glycosyltransferase
MRPATERLISFISLGLPWVISAVIGAWLFFAIPVEPLLHTDEIRTAERSRGFLLNGDFWIVREGEEPIFAKPPLQYWLTAPLIAWLGPCEYAVRLWSVIFAAGGIAAAAWLAKILWPGHQFVMPLASFLVALNSAFLTHGLSGLLDAGQALGFTLLAISVAKTASSQRWWIMSGIVAGLLALQKSPAGLLFLVGFMLVIALERRSLNAVFTPWAIAGLCVAAIPAILWPAIQVANFGSFAYDVMFGQQIVNRFTYGTQGVVQDGIMEYVLGFFTSWKLCSALVVVAVGSAVVISPQGAHPMLRCLSILVLLYGIVAALPKPTYGRYILAIVPISAAIASGILLSLALRHKLFGFLLIFSLVTSLPFEGVNCERSHFNSIYYASQARIAKHLRSMMPPSSKLIIADGQFAIEPRIFAYYMNLPNIPITTSIADLRLDANAAIAQESTELFIVCNIQQSRILRRIYRRAKLILTDGDFELLRISWRESQ